MEDRVGHHLQQLNAPGVLKAVPVVFHLPDKVYDNHNDAYNRRQQSSDPEK
jgi:hypothetical protein